MSAAAPIGNQWEERSRAVKVRALVLVFDASLKANKVHPSSRFACSVIENLTDANWHEAEGRAKINEASPTTREQVRGLYRQRVAEIGKGSLKPITDAEREALTASGIELDAFKTTLARWATL